MASNPDNHKPINITSNPSSDDQTKSALLLSSKADDQANRANVISFSPDINSAVRVNGSNGAQSDMEIIFGNNVQPCDQPINGTGKPSDDQSKTALLWRSSNPSDQENRTNVISTQPFSPNINSAVRVDMSTGAPMGAQRVLSGIDSLRAFDQLLVKQTVKASNLFSDYRGNKEFIIKNSSGQNVFAAVECTDYFTRNCCDGPAFDMKILDMNQREVIILGSSVSCYPFSTPVVEVKLPNGQIIGHVERDLTLLIPKFRTTNARGETVLKVEGPINATSFGGDVDFDIITLSGSKIGKISKHWSGLAREFFTDADHFGIQFPMDLDVYMKATLLGTLMLIDGIFYSK